MPKMRCGRKLTNVKRFFDDLDDDSDDDRERGRGTR